VYHELTGPLPTVVYAKHCWNPTDSDPHTPSFASLINIGDGYSD